jgi:hypothetical protein
VLSLIAVVVVVMLAGSFTQLASSVSNSQAQSVLRKQAFYMAEAGLAEAYAGLMCGRSGNVGTRELPAAFGDGLFWVEAEELDVGMIRLDSIGMVGNGQARLSVVAERGVESIAALGVFSSDGMTLAAGSVIDAYDSSQGSYESQAEHAGAQLGSNATISLNGLPGAPTLVEGDVTPGPDLQVSISGEVTITGSTEPSLEATDLPPVELPEIQLGPGQKYDSPYPLVVPPGECGYEMLDIATGSQVVVQGPATVVVGSLSLQPGAELAFDTDRGPVHLYVTQALELADKSLLTTSSTSTEDVIIQVAHETLVPVTLRALSTFHGVLYAPEAEIVVASGFEVFGALVGRQLSFEGAVRLHFDKHLASYAAEAALPRFLSWRIINLASSSTDLASSPFALLGVDRQDLPQPRHAHEDQLLEIDYIDKLGLYHTYSGMESRFDWDVVQSVLKAKRAGTPLRFPRAPAKTGVAKHPGEVAIVDGPMV